MYWEAIRYPFSMWLLYIVVFSFIAIIGAPGIAYLFLIGSGSFLLAILFGIWVGLSSSRLAPKRLSHALLSSFSLGFLIGFISFIFELGLAMLSPKFLNLAAPNIIQMLPISVASWCIIIMLASLGSAIGFEFNR